MDTGALEDAVNLTWYSSPLTTAIPSCPRPACQSYCKPLGTDTTISPADASKVTPKPLASYDHQDVISLVLKSPLLTSCVPAARAVVTGRDAIGAMTSMVTTKNERNLD